MPVSNLSWSQAVAKRLASSHECWEIHLEMDRAPPLRAEKQKLALSQINQDELSDENLPCLSIGSEIAAIRTLVCLRIPVYPPSLLLPGHSWGSRHPPGAQEKLSLVLLPAALHSMVRLAWAPQASGLRAVTHILFPRRVWALDEPPVWACAWWIVGPEWTSGTSVCSVK